MNSSAQLVRGFSLLILCSLPPRMALAQARPRAGLPPGDTSVVSLQGTIQLEGGKEHGPGAKVQLLDDRGYIAAEDYATSGGQFHLEGLRPTVYFLNVTAVGYTDYNQMLDLTTVGNSLFINITLSPSSISEVPTVSPPSRTDAMAPKKARKEFEKGELATKLKKTDEARAHYTKAVEIYPCYARAQTDLALTLMKEHESPESEAPLKKAIECDPDYTEAYLHLGRLLNVLNRYSESRGVLAEGVRRSPSSWRLYFNLAQADEGLNNYPLAEQEFLRAESFGPTASIVHERFANLYLKGKAYDKAYVEMQAYLNADPNGRYAAKVKEVIAQLESAGLVHPLQSKSVPTAPLNP